MRGKDTKERIVEEAFALFASRGFHAVSVRDIAAAVGIKDASLYNHFSGKQAIFDAIVRDALERTRRFFGERNILFDVSDDATPYEEMNAERMHEMVLPSFRYFFEDPYMVRLRHLLVISQFESEEAGRVYRLVFVEQPMALQRTIFEHLMATGEFVRDDAAQMAVELQGVPFMLMCAKVQKPGAVVIMGLIVALIYFATGMFTPLILAMMAASCVVAEVIRAVARYRSFLGNAVAYAVFGLGMCGSPLPLWVFHDSFVSQIAEQGMGADYLASLDALSTTPMLIAMFAVTIVAGLAGAYIARCLFKKHFEKAGLV